LVAMSCSDEPTPDKNRSSSDVEGHACTSGDFTGYYYFDGTPVDNGTDFCNLLAWCTVDASNAFDCSDLPSLGTVTFYMCDDFGNGDMRCTSCDCSQDSDCDYHHMCIDSTCDMSCATCGNRCHHEMPPTGCAGTGGTGGTGGVGGTGGTGGTGGCG